MMPTTLIDYITKIITVLLFFLGSCNRGEALLTEHPDHDPCNSQIFCHGKLLHTIQTAGIFKDSKTFVDMCLISSPESTLKRFDMLMEKAKQAPSKEEIHKFILANFQEAYEELEYWVPMDYKTNPKFLKQIDDIKMRGFAKSLNALWSDLGRRVKHSVRQHAVKFSLIPVPNGFVVPGGRFREYYYWDSYWIMRGLLICDMTSTVKGMLDNFVSIVEQFGFIPNGGRIYYLDRSQPPMLTMMVNEYLIHTKDFNWVKINYKFLERELHYWLKKKTVKVTGKAGKAYVLARYKSDSFKPRPESYIEDIHTASIFKTQEGQKNCYRNLRTGAETGWDFSTRWFFDDRGGNTGNLSNIDATRVFPVELNSFLWKDFSLMSQWATKMGMMDKAKFWGEKANVWKETIMALLFSDTDGTWYDLDIQLMRKRRSFYPTNLAPLWVEMFQLVELNKYGKSCSVYLKRQGIVNFQGGVPTTLTESGEQWDYPNAWAPLQSIVIFALEKSGNPDAKQMAREIAKKWITSNYKQFDRTSEMYEKYNALVSGMFGIGGEYEVQTGFGWSNGVILELIDFYYIQNKKDVTLS